MVLGHLLMGAASLVMLPFFWGQDVPPLRKLALPAVCSSMFYMIGQVCLFLVLRRVHASRVSPLLGLKIAILALITAFIIPGGAVTPLQWLAVGISVAAAFVLNESGGRLSPGLIVTVLTGCLFYSLSDMSIRWLIDSLAQLGKFAR